MNAPAGSIPPPYLSEASDGDLPSLAGLAVTHNLACRRSGEFAAPTYDDGGHSAFAMMLYWTLIELCGCMASLCRERRFTGVAAVARSALDAYVDLGNIFEDPAYVERLKDADMFDWGQRFTRASAGKNPMMADILRDPEFAQMRKVPARYLRTRPHAAKQGAQERFAAIGMKNTYESVWAILSAETHNNLLSLYRRHVTFVEEAQRCTLYSGQSIELCDGILKNFARFLESATNEMHVKYGGNVPQAT